MIKCIVKKLTKWAWKDELNQNLDFKWKNSDDWWKWYVIEIGEPTHDTRGHANPIVNCAWNAARQIK